MAGGDALKTLAELENLSDHELSQILAAMNGWEFCIRARTKHGIPLPWTMEHCRHPSYTCGRWRPMGRMVKYAQDLNACHEVEMRLTNDCDYISYLRTVTKGEAIDMIFAPARLRTIALILALQTLE